MKVNVDHLFRVKMPHVAGYYNAIGKNVIHHLRRSHGPREAHVADGDGSGTQGEDVGALSSPGVTIEIDQHADA